MFLMKRSVMENIVLFTGMLTFYFVSIIVTIIKIMINFSFNYKKKIFTEVHTTEIFLTTGSDCTNNMMMITLIMKTEIH